jgi:hypothetical protein
MQLSRSASHEILANDSSLTLDGGATQLRSRTYMGGGVLYLLNRSPTC